MSRPMGEVARAMLSAASGGPGTVRCLAERAQVGYGLARVTAHRLVERGHMTVLEGGRPAVLAVSSGPVQEAEANQLLVVMGGSFWEQADADGA
jgi:hypothetical protein